jgi:hypothetical protein
VRFCEHGNETSSYLKFEEVRRHLRLSGQDGLLDVGERWVCRSFFCGCRSVCLKRQPYGFLENLQEKTVGRVAQSVERLATGWTVRGSNPSGGEIFRTGPGAHPASCTMGTGSYPRVESGRGVTLTPLLLLVPRSKIRVEL